MSRLNHFLFNSVEPEKFVTACYGVLDSKANRFTYVNAGHNPPLLVRADGDVEYLTTGGLLLGVLDHADYDHQVIDLARGDMIVFYTDGITEAMSEDGEEFGDKRLKSILQKTRKESPPFVLDRVIREVREFASSSYELDDMTLIVLQRH